MKNTTDRRRYLVYMATNRVNGKRYIGITKRDFAVRKRQHLRLAEDGNNVCCKFYSAIRKYGKKSFDWKIVASDLSQRDAFSKERALIKKIRKTGEEYNIKDGGTGGGGVAYNRQPVICLDDGVVYKSLTAAAKAYNICHASEVSANCSGKRIHVKGKHFCYGSEPLSKKKRLRLVEEMIASQAKRRRRVKKHKGLYGEIVDGRDSSGRLASGPMSISKQVICLDDLEIFPSATAAALHYQVARSSLIELCLGREWRHAVGGRRFCYLENYKPEMATVKDLVGGG